MVLPGQKSQRELFEEAWGKHIDGDHPNALALHVERRADDAQVWTTAVAQKKLLPTGHKLSPCTVHTAVANALIL